MAKAKVLPQYLAGLSASFGGYILGASIGWTSPIEDVLLSGGYGFEISTSSFGWISSLLTLGGAFACVPAGFLIDRFGRKPTMLGLIPFNIVAWLLIIFACNVTMMYFGRFLLGLSGAAFCVTAPMYTTEIAQVELRGTMGGFFELLIVNGILYVYIIGAFVNYQIFNILCTILPIIFVVFFVFMPESPVYLVQKGREEAAKKSLQWLRGQEYDVSAELDALVDDVKKQKNQKINIWAALKRPVTIKGMVISIALQVFQQWSGNNAIVFYTTSIFEEANIGISSSIATIIVGVVMVGAALVAVIIIDKVGRRVLLLVSAFFMIITTAPLGAYFLMKDNDPSTIDKLGWLPVSCVSLYILFIEIGFGPVPWLINAELFSDDIKSVAGSIAVTFNWLMAFMVTLLFPIFRESFGEATTFWIYTAIDIVAFLYTFFAVPETKGKTLDEIQSLLAGTSTKKAKCIEANNDENVKERKKF